MDTSTHEDGLIGSLCEIYSIIWITYMGSCTFAWENPPGKWPNKGAMCAVKATDKGIIALGL